MHRLLLRLEHGFISTGLEPGDVQGAHFHSFRRASAAEGMGRVFKNLRSEERS